MEYGNSQKGHSANGDESCIPRTEGNDYVKRLGEGTIGSECLKDNCPVEKQCIKQTKNNLCKRKAWCSIKDTTDHILAQYKEEMYDNHGKDVQDPSCRN